jgi:hypothetical protein
MNWWLLILLCRLLIACDGPNDKIVRREFLSEHPNASIESIGVGEGDSDHAYYHIQYKLHKLPSDDRVLEEIWLYQKQTDGTWARVYKQEPKEFKKY